MVDTPHGMHHLQDSDECHRFSLLFSMLVIPLPPLSLKRRCTLHLSQAMEILPILIVTHHSTRKRVFSIPLNMILTTYSPTRSRPIRMRRLPKVQRKTMPINHTRGTLPQLVPTSLCPIILILKGETLHSLAPTNQYQAHTNHQFQTSTTTHRCRGTTPP